MSYKSYIPSSKIRVYKLNLCVAIISIIFGFPSASMSAVFEQLSDGTLASLKGNDPEGRLSLRRDVQKGDNKATGDLLGEVGNRTVGASAPGVSTAVVLDAPMDDLKAAKKDFLFAWPELKTETLSLEQMRMRRMAIEVAVSYSNHPAVAHAGLDRKTFVTLFTNIIRRESNFRPMAVSSAGAKGLGQLMPDTARELGVCNVFSPRENLHGAATYLTSMLARFGSPAAALAAYNAGPGAVERHGGIPPFHETRQYVANIIRDVKHAQLADLQVASAYGKDDGLADFDMKIASLPPSLYTDIFRPGCDHQTASRRQLARSSD